MTAKNKIITVPVVFDNLVIKAVQEAPDFHEFCRLYECKDCAFHRTEDCEYTFDSFKEELEK